MLSGSIKAEKSIRLTETAKVWASLSSRIFSMEEGALFKGDVLSLPTQA